MNIFSSQFGTDGDTIAAVATPAGTGGIGIVRISGELAETIAKRIFSSSKAIRPGIQPNENLFPSHRLIHGFIKDPQSSLSVDEVLLVVMRAPHSYTREDVVEIQSHGGRLIVSKILDLVMQQGARLAEPGEFTRRAFLNGRIDLSQAEAVADIIQAKSKNALAVASHHLDGGLRKKMGELRNSLIRIIADIEAEIEFSEDVGTIGDRKRRELAIELEQRVAQPIETLIKSYQSGRVLREGLRIVIVGRPNVGKSSLMNRLVGKEKAIVTPIPGTTRDTVEDRVPIGNVEMHVADTAGLHDSSDPVEIIGMQKTKERIAIADVILLVVEAHRAIQQEDISICDLIDSGKSILVWNKTDLRDGNETPVLQGKLRELDAVSISAKEGTGIDFLKKYIAERCIQGIHDQFEESILANVRHKNALDQALSFIDRGRRSLMADGQEDLASMDLMQAVERLDVITGDRIEEEVLDSVFKNFCIGK